MLQEIRKSLSHKWEIGHLHYTFTFIGDGPDPAKVPHKKAKQMRRERTLEKLKEKGIDITTLSNTSKNKEKQVEDFINELPDDVKHKLEVKFTSDYLILY